MVGEGSERGAGASAQEQADRKRQHAERLRAQAAKWEAGAEGERRTAAVLASLPPSFVVLHDLPVSGSKANIDHLVIGPPGAFVVDSKHYDRRYPIRRGPDTLFGGRYPMRREIDTVRWEADQVAHRLGCDVQPVLCFVNDNLEESGIWLDGLVALNLSSIVTALTSLPSVLDVAEVERITAVVRGPDHGTAATVRALRPTGRPSRPPRTPRPASPTSSRRPTPGRTSPRGLGSAALAIVAMLVGVPALNRSLRASTDGSSRPTAPPRAPATVAATRATSPTAPTTSPTAPPPTGTAVFPTVTPSVDYRCPGPGQGWTMTLRWPDEIADATHVKWSWRRPAADGLIGAPLWTRGAPNPGLADITPGATTEIHYEVTTSSGTLPVATTVATAPSEPC